MAGGLVPIPGHSSHCFPATRKLGGTCELHPEEGTPSRTTVLPPRSDNGVSQHTRQRSPLSFTQVLSHCAHPNPQLPRASLGRAKELKVLPWSLNQSHVNLARHSQAVSGRTAPHPQQGCLPLALLWLHGTEGTLPGGGPGNSGPRVLPQLLPFLRGFVHSPRAR